MLFRLDAKNLSPVAFKDIGTIGGVEKDLENILADNMLPTLFEDNPYMVIFQERAYQAEPDIIALDRAGNLVLIEIKRSYVAANALEQVFRYAHTLYRWNYEILQSKYNQYLEALGQPTITSLRECHREVFGLDSAVDERDFNGNQKLIIVGNSTDEALISYVDYWRSRGIDIDFIPYRIYEIEHQLFLEFFAKPYDLHSNPSDLKGVIFDSNRSYDPKALEHMLKNNRVSAFGDRQDAVSCLRPNDFVFLSHKFVGVVAAAQVKSRVKNAETEDGDEECYVEVKYLTPAADPIDDTMPRISYSEIYEEIGKTFFHARIDKRPFLTKEESEKLVAFMIKRFASRKKSRAPS